MDDDGLSTEAWCPLAMDDKEDEEALAVPVPDKDTLTAWRNSDWKAAWIWAKC